MNDADSSALLRKLQLTFELAATGEQLMRGRFRREHPDASDDEIALLLRRWFQERPGAENGDGEGVVVAWPRLPR